MRQIEASEPWWAYSALGGGAGEEADSSKLLLFSETASLSARGSSKNYFAGCLYRINQRLHA